MAQRDQRRSLERLCREGNGGRGEEKRGGERTKIKNCQMK